MKLIPKFLNPAGPLHYTKKIKPSRVKGIADDAVVVKTKSGKEYTLKELRDLEANGLLNPDFYISDEVYNQGLHANDIQIVDLPTGTSTFASEDAFNKNLKNGYGVSLELRNRNADEAGKRVEDMFKTWFLGNIGLGAGIGALGIGAATGGTLGALKTGSALLAGNLGANLSRNLADNLTYLGTDGNYKSFGELITSPLLKYTVADLSPIGNFAIELPGFMVGGYAGHNFGMRAPTSNIVGMNTARASSTKPKRISVIAPNSEPVTHISRIKGYTDELILDPKVTEFIKAHALDKGITEEELSLFNLSKGYRKTHSTETVHGTDNSDRGTILVEKLPNGQKMMHMAFTYNKSPRLSDYLYRLTRGLSIGKNTPEKFKNLGVVGKQSEKLVENGRALAADVRGLILEENPELLDYDTFIDEFDIDKGKFLKYLEKSHGGAYISPKPLFKNFKIKGIEKYYDYNDGRYKLRYEYGANVNEILNNWFEALMEFKNGGKLYPRLLYK